MELIRNLGLALIFPFLGIAVLYFCSKILHLQVKIDSALVIALVVTPLAGFAILSGHITEWRGLGLEVKFLASQEVSIAGLIPINRISC